MNKLALTEILYGFDIPYYFFAKSLDWTQKGMALFESMVIELKKNAIQQNAYFNKNINFFIRLNLEK